MQYSKPIIKVFGSDFRGLGSNISSYRQPRSQGPLSTTREEKERGPGNEVELSLDFRHSSVCIGVKSFYSDKFVEVV